MPWREPVCPPDIWRPQAPHRQPDHLRTRHPAAHLWARCQRHRRQHRSRVGISQTSRRLKSYLGRSISYVPLSSDTKTEIWRWVAFTMASQTKVVPLAALGLRPPLQLTLVTVLAP